MRPFINLIYSNDIIALIVILLAIIGLAAIIITIIDIIHVWRDYYGK